MTSTLAHRTCSRFLSRSCPELSRFLDHLQRSHSHGKTELRKLYFSTTSKPDSPDCNEISNLVRWDVHPVPNHPSKMIGSITLQSPSTFNALTVEMGNEFLALCRKITDNEIATTSDTVEVAAIVLTGQGEQAFSAGGNLAWLRSLGENSVHANADAMLRFYKSFLCVRQLPVPVIAPLQGPAVGAGAGLALACDLRTAAVGHERILGLNFTRLGIHSGMGGSHFLSQALGGQATVLNEILLTGKILSTAECLDLGLVNRVSDNPRKDAFDLAYEIAHRHPVAVRTVLQTVRRQQDHGLEQALQREAFAQAICYARGDWPEGVNAVAEKREPKFDPYHSK